MAHEERRDQSDTIEGQFGEEILKALVQNLWLQKELGQSMVQPLHFYEQSNQQRTAGSIFITWGKCTKKEETKSRLTFAGTCKFLIAVDIQ